MQIGFVHSDSDEFRKVSQLWKTLTEEGAIDELGIGRIRDYFSDSLFPGTSTLWKHTKYFSLLPQLYMHATQKSYNSRKEVKKYLIDLERKMTESLLSGTPEAKRNGITGSDSVKNKTKFVKYDPTYIYYAGMRKYGILHTEDVEGMIFEYSKKIHSAPDTFKSQGDEDICESVDKGNMYQFCSCPTGNIDSFDKPCSLELKRDEAEYIQTQVSTCLDVKGTLLHYLITELPEMDSDIHNFNIDTLPSSLQPKFYDARIFSKFIYGPHLFYNYVLSKGTDDKIYSKYRDWLTEWKEYRISIKSILEKVKISETSSIDFCVDFENHLDDEKYLFSLVTKREKKVKGSRYKINKEVYDPKHPYHNYYLSFRWNVVKMMVDEIRDGLKNG